MCLQRGVATDPEFAFSCNVLSDAHMQDPVTLQAARFGSLDDAAFLHWAPRLHVCLHRHTRKLAKTNLTPTLPRYPQSGT